MTVVWLVFSEYYDGETTWTTFHSAWADEATAREVCAKKPRLTVDFDTS